MNLCMSNGFSVTAERRLIITILFLISLLISASVKKPINIFYSFSSVENISSISKVDGHLGSKVDGHLGSKVDGHLGSDFCDCDDKCLDGNCCSVFSFASNYLSSMDFRSLDKTTLVSVLYVAFFIDSPYTPPILY
ncbi:hypothetical protein SAMN02745753_00774 [Marinomonas polaris DSM 16579]|uniref:Uncharacterized protein n=1 Tax=Marinomonas polaris DSM 16579 TaxID=1122206 RepID=A0A1M4VXT0_9GAMM|nr:hypothetical protein SAMN02745753_00774 [Marinomonas polaris DSM 16579]